MGFSLGYFECKGVLGSCFGREFSIGERVSSYWWGVIRWGY